MPMPLTAIYLTVRPTVDTKSTPAPYRARAFGKVGILRLSTKELKTADTK